jgi:hypothetical protein
MAGTVGDRYRGADNALPDSRSHDFTLPCCHVAPRATLLRATKEPNPHPTTPLAHSICLFYCSQINGEPDRAPQRATQEIKQIKHFHKVFSSFSFTFGSLSFPLSVENSNQECLKMGEGRPPLRW